VWGVAFLNFWKRKNAFLLFDWNMLDYTNKELVRADYNGEERKGTIYEEEWLGWEEPELIATLRTAHLDVETMKVPISKYYPPYKSWTKRIVSMLPFAFMVLVVIMVTVGVLTLRLKLAKIIQVNFPIGSAIGATVNAVSIIILNVVYTKLAVALTNWGKSDRKTTNLF
jgi:hypothetical protein